MVAEDPDFIDQSLVDQRHDVLLLQDTRIVGSAPFLVPAFAGTPVKPQTFHGICMALLPQEGEAVNMEIWLDGNKFDYDVIRRLGVSAMKMEIEWIWDIGITSREAYLEAYPAAPQAPLGHDRPPLR